MASNKLTKTSVISYNCHGLNQSHPLLDDLCNAGNASVIMLQEHWLNSSNLSKVLNFSPKYSGFGISAMDSVLVRSVLRGRPYGGVATLVRNDFLPQTNCLKCAERYTIVAVGQTIFINVYLPCYSPDSINIVNTMLVEIKEILMLHPGHELVMGGDMNTVLSDSSRSSGNIRQFLTDLSLIIVNELIRPNCDYTFFNEAQKHYSFVDYFMCSSAIMNDSVEFRVLDDMVNMSDHCAIYLSIPLRMGASNPPTANKSEAASRQSHRSYMYSLRWDHAPSSTITQVATLDWYQCYVKLTSSTLVIYRLLTMTLTCSVQI